MRLRKYTPNDCTALADLFFSTVHTINAKDYTKAQLDVWATGNIDAFGWNQIFLEHNTVVAEINGAIIGFGDMSDNGYLDKLYVHKDYQAQGVATAIVNELEKHAMVCGISLFTTHASITARPFFEKRGYHVVRENVVVRGNIALTNFIMEKNMVK